MNWDAHVLSLADCSTQRDTRLECGFRFGYPYGVCRSERPSREIPPAARHLPATRTAKRKIMEGIIGKFRVPTQPAPTRSSMIYRFTNYGDDEVQEAEASAII